VYCTRRVTLSYWLESFPSLKKGNVSGRHLLASFLSGSQVGGCSALCVQIRMKVAPAPFLHLPSLSRLPIFPAARHLLHSANLPTISGEDRDGSGSSLFRQRQTSNLCLFQSPQSVRIWVLSQRIHHFGSESHGCRHRQETLALPSCPGPLRHFNPPPRCNTRGPSLHTFTF